jgi:ribosomal protein S18 acetylase RimI-like enzyme
VLARAFRDNPLNRSVIGLRAGRRLRVNRAGMQAGLTAALGRGDLRVARPEGRRVAGGEGRRVVGDPVLGVLVALPPSAYPLPPPPWPVQLRTLLRQGLAVARRWREVFETLHERHPAEPHWHLALLGVAPERQRRGVGSALLRQWLATVDERTTLVWLETDRAENVPFYEAAGFAVRQELVLRGVPVWLMARPPRAAL